MGMDFLLCLIVLLPGGVCALLGVGWLLGWEPRERTVARLTAMTYSAAAIAVVLLAAGMLRSGTSYVSAELGNWFEVEHHHFPLKLAVDRLSLPLLALSVLLVGVVGVFSVRYIHREPGFFRFFLLMHLFGFGILLLFAAGSFDLLIVGWELVGLTSVLLIAFFQHRDEPVQNALRVFATYRVCDIGLLTGVVLLHHHAGSTLYSSVFRQQWPGGGVAPLGDSTVMIGLLLVLAAMGKGAQIPFSGWLPRAMEGPTPSSAIFYGALSVHAGAYLLLRAQPILAQSPIVSGLVVAVGLLTALHGTMAGRVAADAKTLLAHASVTQLGLIFMEIGLGWSWLAVLHICGHAAIRTLEFLRAPSMLHDYHRLHAAAGGHLVKPGSHYELLLPAGVRAWLYRYALDRSHLDTILDRLLLGPFLAAARWLYHVEKKCIDRIFGARILRKRQPAARAGLYTGGKKPESTHA